MKIVNIGIALAFIGVSIVLIGGILVWIGIGKL